MESRAAAREAYGWFRRWMGKVWQVRGGGLYATGYLVTFIYLEITTIVGEIRENSGVVDFFSEQLIEFLLRFSVDSIMNMIEAFMWPVAVIQIAPPWGAVGLGVAFVVFSTFLQKPVERWLLGD